MNSPTQNDNASTPRVPVIAIHGGAGTISAGTTTPEQAAAVVVRIATVVDGWVAHFQALGVTERDIRELSAFIDHPDLLEQRRTAMSHVQALMPPAGRSPRRGGAFRM